MKKIIRSFLTWTLVAVLAAGGAGCTGKAKRAYHERRANKFYDAGQFDRAEIEYLNVLRSDPGNARAFGRLGTIYYQQGRLQTAGPFLYKASSLATNDLDLRLKLGMFYAAAGKLKEAGDAATFVLDRQPQDADAPLLLAEAAGSPAEIETARARLRALAKGGDRAPFEVGLGMLACREQDFPAGKTCFLRAVSLDPKSAPAYAALGALCTMVNDTNGAETNFKAAAEFSDARSARRLIYARFKLQTGDLPAAKQILADAVKSAPDFLPALLGLAEIAMVEKKFTEAHEFSDKVLARDPDNFDGLMFAGRLNLAEHEPDKAVGVFERITKLYPQASHAHCELALAYLSAEDATKAVVSLNRALELEPGFVQAQLLLAESQINSRNPDPVIVAMTRLSQKLPQLMEAKLLLANAYRLRNRTGDALAIYQSLEKDHPKDPRMPLLAGTAAMQLKDYARARNAFARVQELVPDSLSALEQLVNLDLMEKNYDAARARVQAEVQKKPKLAALQLIVAKVWLVQGKTDQAEAALLKVDELEPGNLNSALLLAQMYFNAKQNDKALVKLEVILAKYPKDISALMLVATIQEQEKDYKKAAAAYEKVLAADPKFSLALNNLAYLYSEVLGQLDRAYELAQRARVLLPFDPSTADTLGWIHLRRGAYGTALGLLQESAAKMPGVPEAQFHFGMANYLTDDEDAARAAFQRALQTGAEFRGREECQLCLALLDISPPAADAAARAKLAQRVSEKPEDPVAQGRLAAIFQREGNSAKAVAGYEAVVKTDPKNVPALLNLARLYAPQDAARALATAKTANKLAPNNAEVTRLLGRLTLQAGDFKLAAGLLQTIAKNQPDDAPAQFDFAQAAYGLGKISTARAAMQNALQLNLPAPQAAEARRLLELSALADHPAEAVAASSRVEEILKAEPAYVPALMAQAVIKAQNGDAPAAAAAGEKIIARCPDFAPAQRLLAILYARDATKAAAAYAFAMKSRDDFPDDPALAKAIGIIHFQQGDFSRAAKLLKDCAAKADTDAEIFYYLGSAQFRLKDRPASRASLQSALNLKLSGADADAARQLLGELK